MTHTDKNALIIVDVQKGFIPVDEWGTGELGVTWGGLIVPIINDLMQEVRRTWGLILASRDLHPVGHMSFASNYVNRNLFEQIGWEDVVNGKENTPILYEKAGFTLGDLQAEFWAGNGKQVLWPEHCIEGTESAGYHEGLDISKIDHHIIKGYDARTEMYSGFFGKEDRKDPQIVRLSDILKNTGVTLVKVVWIATDYCVHATALDALKNGFDVQVITKAIAGVSPSDSIKRLEELRSKGVEIVE